MTTKIKKETGEWVKMKPTEVEQLIVDLSRKGNSPEKIGLILRDEHGIPRAKVFGKKLSQILKENKIESQPLVKRIESKVEKLTKHYQKHKHDYTAQRAIAEYNSRIGKINRLAR